MNDLAAQIIDYIKINRVSTTELADALGKTGEINPLIKPVSKKMRCVGMVYYVPAINESNWYTHYYLQNVPKNAVVFVEGINCNNKAIFGSLVAKYACLYKQVSGMVVSGYIRDIQEIIKQDYPVWALGSTPIGCFNVDNGIDEELIRKQQEKYNNGIILADDGGVIFVEKNKITKELLENIDRIEKQEDIWFDCIDRLKYSTFETVCLKKYLQKEEDKGVSLSF